MIDKIKAKPKVAITVAGVAAAVILAALGLDVEAVCKSAMEVSR